MLELQLSSFGSVPFGREVLLPLLRDYRRPNDKISEWLRQGVLVSLKRGFYVVGPAWRKGELSLPLVANRLYGPSCVSLDYALAWHGLIPERVYAVTSVCPGRGRVFDNALGRFTYTRLPGRLYSVGIRQVEVSGQVAYLIAEPEKALCDKVLLTANLSAASRNAMHDFLIEDIRVAPEALAGLDLEVVEQYARSGIKTRQMQALMLALEALQ